jgi:hypothetical protein
MAAKIKITDRVVIGARLRSFLSGYIERLCRVFKETAV